MKTTHSAYFYAKKYGWTHSGAKTYTARFLDECRLSCEGGTLNDVHFGNNLLAFGIAIAMDIGVAIGRDVRKIADPVERAETIAGLKRDLSKLRRPFYYARETERRRRLAAERRKLARRTTLAQMPTSDDLLEAWNRRKESKENMIVLGGMLHDLECYVDNRLRFDEDGMVVGRNRGIRGWIACNLPEQTLAMAHCHFIELILIMGIRRIKMVVGLRVVKVSITVILRGLFAISGFQGML